MSDPRPSIHVVRIVIRLSPSSLFLSLSLSSSLFLPLPPSSSLFLSLSLSLAPSLPGPLPVSVLHFLPGSALLLEPRDVPQPLTPSLPLSGPAVALLTHTQPRREGVSLSVVMTVTLFLPPSISLPLPIQLPGGFPSNPPITLSSVPVEIKQGEEQPSFTTTPINQLPEVIVVFVNEIHD